MRYLAKISYDGSHFNGFERLKDNTGIQNEIERVLSIINKKEIKISGAGRTDKKVHATSQYFHFDMDINISIDKLIYTFNNLISPYIKLLELKEVDNNFHARYSVKEKEYTYKIYLDNKEPLKEDYYNIIGYKLDINKMIKASNLFIGTHNFKNFTAGSRSNYENTILDIKVIEEGKYLTFIFKGYGFYRYMVRMIMGSIIEVGKGNRTLEDIKIALEDYNNKHEFPVAKPNGLYLTNIIY